MSSKDAHLYGAPRPKKASAGKEITSSSTLSFNTALSSLISASTTRPTTSAASSCTSAPARHRSSLNKPKKSDIFTTHNRNTAKRAAADMLGESDSMAQKHTKNGSHIDEEAWRRTKRKMEEKSRLYAAMKRGDVEDEAEKVMVDFDRKWAENGGAAAEAEEEDEEDDEEEEEMVEYTDEFGRTRRGTRGEAAREERRRNMQSKAAEESDRFTARPAVPSNIIYGDTIQAAAFDPDDLTAAQMDELAKKRDREATPPEAVHYDANREIRNKGTGFFQFSTDEEERVRQMEGLEKERVETERVRREKEGQRTEAKEKRKREVEERRRVILQKRGKIQADRFLEELGGEIFGREEDGE